MNWDFLSRDIQSLIIDHTAKKLDKMHLCLVDNDKHNGMGEMDDDGLKHTVSFVPVMGRRLRDNKFACSLDCDVMSHHENTETSAWFKFSLRRHDDNIILLREGLQNGVKVGKFSETRNPLSMWHCVCKSAADNVVTTTCVFDDNVVVMPNYFNDDTCYTGYSFRVCTSEDLTDIVIAGDEFYNY